MNNNAQNDIIMYNYRRCIMELDRDRRVTKTKNAIRSSLLSLMAEKPHPSISVSELCRRADIGRGTFYLHYNDVYEVVEEIEEEILDYFRDSCFRYFDSENQAGFQALVNNSLLWIKDNEEIFRTFLLDPGSDFSAKFLSYLVDLFYYHDIKYHPSRVNKSSKYKIVQTCSGYLGAVRNWVSDHFPVTCEEFAKLLIS